MKRILSFLIICMFLASGINVSFVSGQSSDNVCCALTTAGDYCVYTDPSNCDSNVPDQVGFTETPFSCGNVEVCNPVWCLESGGICSKDVSKAQCIAQGGAPIKSSEGESVPAQCQKGACVIGGQCNYPIGRDKCKKTAEKLGITFEFDTSISSMQECREKYTREEGCCISGDSCTRTQGRECNGEFHAGFLCSNSQLAGKCTAQRERTKVCGPGGEDVYYQDSLGNLENVVGVPYDGFIHDTEADKAGKIGNCDITQSTICRLNPQGENACVSISCSVGNSFAVNQFVPAEGKVLPQNIQITSAILGNVQKRENGESWCIGPDILTGATKTEYRSSDDDQFIYIHEGDSPGSRHYVYSCVYGEIKVNACGVFRDEVCRQNINSGRSGATCVKNKWEECYEIDDDDGRCRANEFCVLDTSGVNECNPKFPPGTEFTELETLKAPRGQTPDLTCFAGGKRKCGGIFNKCDAVECQSKGDCSYKKPSVIKNTLIGIGIGAAVGGSVEFGFGVGPHRSQFARLFGISPKGLSPSAFAKKLGGDSKVSGKAVIITTAFKEISGTIKELSYNRDKSYSLKIDTEEGTKEYTDRDNVKVRLKTKDGDKS